MITHASPMTISIRSLASSLGGVFLIAIMTLSRNNTSLAGMENILLGFYMAFWSLTVIAAAGLILSFNLKGQKS